MDVKSFLLGILEIALGVAVGMIIYNILSKTVLSKVANFEVQNAEDSDED